MRLSGLFFRMRSTVSPWRTRRKGPGTLPSNVQKVYVVPSARRPVRSTVSRYTRMYPGGRSTMGGGKSVGSRLMSGAFACAQGIGATAPSRIVTSPNIKAQVYRRRPAIAILLKILTLTVSTGRDSTPWLSETAVLGPTAVFRCPNSMARHVGSAARRRFCRHALAKFHGSLTVYTRNGERSLLWSKQRRLRVLTAEWYNDAGIGGRRGGLWSRT